MQTNKFVAVVMGNLSENARTTGAVKMKCDKFIPLMS